MNTGDKVRIKRSTLDKWLVAPGLGHPFVKKFSGDFKVLRIVTINSNQELSTVAVSKIDSSSQYGLFYKGDLELVKNKELL